MHPSTHRLFRNPLLSAFLFFTILIAFSALFFIAYRYAVYAMLTLLSLVAATAGFALFDGDGAKFFSAVGFYAVLVAPFFSAYSQLASRWDLASAGGFAMISIMLVLTAVFLVEDALLGLSFFKLFQLAKRFMKSRRWRYSFSLSTIIVFAASVTSLSFILPFYALLILFLIVVCQVATNIIGNVYERRREIFSLATLGLNPDHFAGLFLAEALTIGFLGGGVGYAVGLYVVILSSLPVTTFVFSTGWMVAVILLSIATAIISATLPAMKASMLATPSLLRRWWRESPPFIGWPPTWTFQMPIKMTTDNAEGFINFFLSYVKMLEEYSYDSIERTEAIQIVRPEAQPENALWKLKFKYIFNELSSPMMITENELKIFKDSTSEELTAEFTIKVIKYQCIQNIYEYLERIASTYRKLAIEWATKNPKTYTPPLDDFPILI